MGRIDIYPQAGTTWTAWTPTLGNLTLGNGTVVARFIKIGTLVTFSFKFVLGSTSAVGSDPSFTLPVIPATDWAIGDFPLGRVALLDAGTNVYPGHLHQDVSSTVVRMRAFNASSTYAAQQLLSSTIPFTWGTADSFFATGSYESAS